VSVRAIRGLKEFLHLLEDLGELQRVAVSVDSRYEIAAVLSHLSREEAPAILFEKVKGYSVPLVANLLGTKKRLALALGMTEEELHKGLLPNLGKRITPYLLREQNERFVFTPKKESGILDLLPVLTHYAKDSGPYITSGITSARDPLKGEFGRGLHRLEVRGNAELGISFVNPSLSDIYAFHKDNGTRMEVATSIGIDPAILVGTVLKMPGTTDKLAGVGGLIGEALSTENPETVDIEIPAYTEITIEGYIDPAEEEKDGTLGEVSGYYLSFMSPTIHITSISHRKEAFYQSILPWSLEVDHLLSFVYGLDFIPKMKMGIPSLLDIHLVPGTFGAHTVMSIDSDNRGEIRGALTMALSFSNIKKAVIVNTDVDPRDPLAVEWAMATRFQADTDLIVIPSLKGQPIDPTSGEGFTTAKVGVDATRPRVKGFEKVNFPEEVQGRLPSLINELKKEGLK